MNNHWVLLIIGALTCGAANATAAKTTPGVQKQAGDTFEADFKFSAESFFTSNYFHVKNSKLSKFANKSAEGERFYRMHAGDFVTHAGGDLSGAWRFGKKQELALELTGDYYFPILNPLAHYAKVGGGVAVDIFKSTRISGELTYLPKRFHKNYKHTFDAGEATAGIYSAAYYRQLSPGVSVRQDLGKDWQAEFTYEFAQRRFFAPFESRNKSGHRFGLGSHYAINSRLEIAAEGGFKRVLTPRDFEYDTTLTRFIQVDRAYNGYFAGLSGRYKKKKCCFVSLAGDLLLKRYTSKTVEDPVYYGRKDTRVGAELKAGIELGRYFLLTIEGGFVRNMTDRVNLTDAQDIDASYREYLGGLGLLLKI